MKAWSTKEVKKNRRAKKTVKEKWEGRGEELSFVSCARLERELLVRRLGYEFSISSRLIPGDTERARTCLKPYFVKEPFC